MLYQFESRCKEQPDLLLGDEVTKLFLSTKGENEDEVSKELVDFLHYITESNEHGLPEECDERLRRLHESIQEIKTSTSVEVEYMKMEERERLDKRRGNRARFKRRENTRKRGRKKRRKNRRKRGRKKRRRTYRGRTACQFINEAFKAESSGR